MLDFLKTTLLGLAFVGVAFVAHADEIVVGGKDFTEQRLLSEITQQLFEANGFDVDRASGMGSTLLRQNMEAGQIDVYWEYTGTSLITYNGVEEKLTTEETYDRVKALDAEKGIVWLNASTANNTYALAMQQATATQHGLSTLSDLAESVNDGSGLSFGSNAEFYSRPDGLRPLQDAYGFEFPRSDIKRMDTGFVYEALSAGQVDVGLVFATDGRIPAFDLVVLRDDLGYFPSYTLAPVIRADVLSGNPVLGDLLNSVSAILTDEIMSELNARVDVDNQSVKAVATEFLRVNGLL